eukprot:TRINITY_DN7048_c0_g1_i10.p1 TRINITY_DN7048_c0_g1~~TRINITY_DN7048_c0_g1_i10.p1  ORF type:complete len:653 (+),score=16.10 TRINITY_DN7048_c0_g1_i10:237-2195(+)
MTLHWRKPLRSQGFSVVTREGFSRPAHMGRGIAQGSPLAVLLFLLLTAEAPDCPHALLSQAYADDVTVVTRLSAVESTWDDLRGWLSGLKMNIATKKVTLIAATPATVSLPVTNGQTIKVNAKTHAPLLGACIHATDASAGDCKRHRDVLEGYTRRCDAFRHNRNLSAFQKAELHNRYAAPRLVLHSISKCCNFKTRTSTWTKISNIVRSIRPVCPKCPWGLSRTTPYAIHREAFASSSKGYAIAKPATAQTLIRTRAYLAVHEPLPLGDLPTSDFEVKRIRKYRPKRNDIFANIREAVTRALNQASAGGEPLRLATDGGYNPETRVATAGVVVGTESFSARLDTPASSSTEAELFAQAILAVAVAGIRLPHGVRRPVQWTDSETSIARRKRADKADPLGQVLALVPWGLPQWDRGHAQNAYINAADAAATAAFTDPATPVVSMTDIYGAAGVDRAVFRKYRFVTLGGKKETKERRITLPRMVQTDTAMNFVKSSINMRNEALVADYLPKWCPKAATDRAKLRKLTKVPGAVDLVQALVSRHVFDVTDGEQCKARRCRAPLDFPHALLAGDAAHTAVLTACPEMPAMGGLRGPAPPPPTGSATDRTRETLARFVDGQPHALDLVARCVRAYTDDPQVRHWTARILRHVNSAL